MNENLDLVEILRNCPKGTKLYSPIVGEVEFNGIDINSLHPIGIRYKSGVDSFTKDGRLFWDCDGECMLFPSKDQRDWSKFMFKSKTQPKFDPNTLQPFDNVLVRDSDVGKWTCTLYSHKDEDKDIYKYVTIDYCYRYCIPYNEDTKHLAGTTEEAPEFYKFWED